MKAFCLLNVNTFIMQKHLFNMELFTQKMRWFLERYKFEVRATDDSCSLESALASSLFLYFVLVSQYWENPESHSKVIACSLVSLYMSKQAQAWIFLKRLTQNTRFLINSTFIQSSNKHRKWNWALLQGLPKMELCQYDHRLSPSMEMWSITHSLCVTF